jgi:protein SCO1/2
MHGERTGIAASLAFLTLAGALGGGEARAQYFRRPVSEINPNIMAIDEKAVLGAKIKPETVLIDQDGRELRWGELIGKPVVLVLSYFSCDGSCSLINSTLAELLRDVKVVRPGEDFRIVTLSFDRHDTLATTGAFRKHLGLAGPLAEHWTFATFKSEDELKSETERTASSCIRAPSSSSRPREAWSAFSIRTPSRAATSSLRFSTPGKDSSGRARSSISR